MGATHSTKKQKKQWHKKTKVQQKKMLETVEDSTMEVESVESEGNVNNNNGKKTKKVTWGLFSVSSKLKSNSTTSKRTLPGGRMSFPQTQGILKSSRQSVKKENKDTVPGACLTPQRLPGTHAQLGPHPQPQTRKLVFQSPRHEEASFTVSSKCEWDNDPNTVEDESDWGSDSTISEITLPGRRMASLHFEEIPKISRPPVKKNEKYTLPAAPLTLQRLPGTHSELGPHPQPQTRKLVLQKSESEEESLSTLSKCEQNYDSKATEDESDWDSDSTISKRTLPGCRMNSAQPKGIPKSSRPSVKKKNKDTVPGARLTPQRLPGTHAQLGPHPQPQTRKLVFQSPEHEEESFTVSSKCEWGNDPNAVEDESDWDSDSTISEITLPGQRMASLQSEEIPKISRLSAKKNDKYTLPAAPLTPQRLPGTHSELGPHPQPQTKKLVLQKSESEEESLSALSKCEQNYDSKATEDESDWDSDSTTSERTLPDHHNNPKANLVEVHRQVYTDAYLYESDWNSNTTTSETILSDEQQEKVGKEMTKTAIEEQKSSASWDTGCSTVKLQNNNRLTDEAPCQREAISSLLQKLATSETPVNSLENKIHQVTQQLTEKVLLLVQDEKVKELSTAQKPQEALFASAASDTTIKQLKEAMQRQEEAMQRLAVENVSLKGTVKQQSEKINALQKEVDEAVTVKGHLEALVTVLQSTLEDQRSREKQSKLSNTAQDLQALWEEEPKSCSKLGLRLAEQEKEKGELNTQTEIEKKEVKKIMGQKKAKDTGLDLEMKRNTELNSQSHNNDQLKQSKRQLEEEVLDLRCHIKSMQMKQKQMEQYCHDAEESTRQDIQQKLDQGNLFLRSQAANDANLCTQVEQKMRKLGWACLTQQDIINQRDSTHTELERYRQLYTDERCHRISLAVKLERTKKQLSEVNSKWLHERSRSLTVRITANSSRVGDYLAKMQNEFDRNISEELKNARAELNATSTNWDLHQGWS